MDTFFTLFPHWRRAPPIEIQLELEKEYHKYTFYEEAASNGLRATYEICELGIVSLIFAYGANHGFYNTLNGSHFLTLFLFLKTVH